MASDQERPEELGAPQDLFLHGLHLRGFLPFADVPNEEGADLQKGTSLGLGKVQAERVREETPEPQVPTFGPEVPLERAYFQSVHDAGP